MSSPSVEEERAMPIWALAAVRALAQPTLLAVTDTWRRVPAVMVPSHFITAMPLVRKRPVERVAMSSSRTPTTGTPAAPATATPTPSLAAAEVTEVTLLVSTITAVLAERVEPP